MSDVTVITHFSQPNWPYVNKLSAISKCLEVKKIHCSTVENLKTVLSKPIGGRILFITDEGLIDFVQHLDSNQNGDHIEVAMLIDSPLASVAQRISKLDIVKYLIGSQQAETSGRDLSILIKKFADGDILDLNKYLAFGCKIHDRIVNSTESRIKVIESVGQYVSRLGDPGYEHPYHEYARRVCELTDELLLNAVFSSNAKMKNADRSKHFQLPPSEEVNVAWGYDGEYFGISVCDKSGSFPFETIMHYVSSKRRMDQISPGGSAGIGLKLIFERAHQVITNIKKEQITEIIVLVKFGDRLLEFENQKKSFYYFEDSGLQKKSGG